LVLNQPEVTAQALSILRTGTDFQWYLIPFLAFVIYAYASEIERKNWRPVAAGLSLYGVHWLFEIANALIQHVFGHALWTVPTGTALLLLVGVGAELSLMFSVAGLVLSKLLPADPKAGVLGLPNRWVFAVGNAALFSLIEILLARTPAFVWVWPWWGAIPVFLTVYIPFFAVSFQCYDWKPRVQRIFIASLFGLDAVLLVVFAGILGWI
jgi:hypothetical protein